MAVDTNYILQVYKSTGSERTNTLHETLFGRCPLIKSVSSQELCPLISQIFQNSEVFCVKVDQVETAGTLCEVNVEANAFGLFHVDVITMRAILNALSPLRKISVKTFQSPEDPVASILEPFRRSIGTTLTLKEKTQPAPFTLTKTSYRYSASEGECPAYVDPKEFEDDEMWLQLCEKNKFCFESPKEYSLISLGQLIGALDALNQRDLTLYDIFKVYENNISGGRVEINVKTKQKLLCSFQVNNVFISTILGSIQEAHEISIRALQHSNEKTRKEIIRGLTQLKTKPDSIYLQNCNFSLADFTPLYPLLSSCSYVNIERNNLGKVQTDEIIHQLSKQLILHKTVKTDFGLYTL